MNGPSNVPIVLPIPSGTAPRADRLASLIARLPPRIGRATARLLHPHMRWARIPAGILLVIGGVFSILPVLGIWMLPLGLILLAEDVPILRRWRESGLDWIERHRPHWIHGKR
jgi:hypothetical protein